METMPRPRPPYLHRVTTRHGRVVWYVRLGVGQRKRIQLRAKFGTPEFEAEYRAALSGQAVYNPPPSADTLSWLIDRYRETTAWSLLSLATRRQRENILKQVLRSAAGEPVTRITKAAIIAGRDRRAHAPSQARHFLQAMRGLFRWALEADHIKIDPTHGVNDPPRPKSGGFPVWTEDDVAAYERRWPMGTRQRVWLDVLLYTGLRRGDAVRLGRQHVRDGIATIQTEKSGFTVEVSLPVLPVLAATLRAGPCGDLVFISGVNGKPLSKETFGNEFREACRAASVPGSAHGLRKIAATRAANNGATVAELEAIFGWSGGGMASLYTRAADRRRLARGAMHKLENEKRTSMDAPEGKVRPSGSKDKR